MKRIKSVLLMLLACLTLSVFISCGEEEVPEPCAEHIDEDEDGACDKCSEAIDENEGGEPEDKDALILAKDGSFKFQFVVAEGSSEEVYTLLEEANDIAKKIASKLSVSEEYEYEEELEVLVGTVTSRGEKYEYDRYSLGSEGYIIKRIDTKILILGGSDEATLTALSNFIENTLKLTKKATKLEDIFFSEKDSLVNPQKVFDIKNVTVNGVDVRGYTIVTDASLCEKAADILNDSAKTLQEALYERAGYYLPIIGIEDADDSLNSIYIRITELDGAGDTGFRARTDGESYYIECAHYNKFEDAFKTYFNKNIRSERGDTLKLKAYTSEEDISVVYYSEFDAVGDGVTDDYEAIKATHEFANEGGQTVYADYGKTYLLKDAEEPITVMTDVNWNGATLIFDGRNASASNDLSIFVIKSTENTTYATVKMLTELNSKKNEDGYVLSGMDSAHPSMNIGFAPGFAAFLTIYNKNYNNYIRYGYVDNVGAQQKEVVLVDKDGNIDPSTPLLHDFTEITSIAIQRTDIPTLTVQNAKIESYVSLINLYPNYKYINRNIRIERPNTEIRKLVHEVKGEIPKNEPVKTDENGLSYSVANQGYTVKNGFVYDKDGKLYQKDDIKPFYGHAYNGIINVVNTHNVKVKDCVFQSRVYYNAGTYDIGANTANLLVFEDCTQSNFYEADANGNPTELPNMSKCWGVSGTNYCKNMEYIRCELTRYDAHAGVTNGKIVDSKIAVLSLIGGGEFLLENTTIVTRSNAPITLRYDYGASFNGTLTIRNCKIVDAWGTGTLIKAIFNVSSANEYKGYTSHFPNIIIDNLEIDTTNKEVALVADSSSKYSSTNHYPTRNIIREAVHDKDALFDYYYETKDPHHFDGDPYFKNYLDKLEIVDNGDGTYTLIFRQIPNQCPYMPPEYIEVSNNEDNGYQLTLYNARFFKETDIRADGKNLKRVDP